MARGGVDVGDERCDRSRPAVVQTFHDNAKTHQILPRASQSAQRLQTSPGCPDGVVGAQFTRCATCQRGFSGHQRSTGRRTRPVATSGQQATGAHRRRGALPDVALRHGSSPCRRHDPSDRRQQHPVRRHPAAERRLERSWRARLRLTGRRAPLSRPDAAQLRRSQPHGDVQLHRSLAELLRPEL